MIDPTTIQYVNAGLSVLALGGILSLRAVHIGDESFHFFTVSLGLSAVLIVLEAGVRAVIVVPPHVVHAVAAILLVVALYDPVENRVRTEEWQDLMLRSVDATETDITADDRRILEVFATPGITLTPDPVSTNVDGVDEDVDERLEELADQGLVVRANGRKFRITPLGKRLLQRANESTP